MRKAKRIRENADYGDFVEITKEDAQMELEHAKEFVEQAQNSLHEIIKDVNE